MRNKSIALLSAAAILAATGAVAQSGAAGQAGTPAANSAAKGEAAANKDAPASGQSRANWVPPGTPGSPVNGEIFHAQVTLDRLGFSPGVIDGKPGISFDDALRGFQTSRGLPVNGKLDNATKVALLREMNIPSTVRLRLDPTDLQGPFVGPIPEDAALKAKMPRLGYRNAVEALAEKFHTTPETLVALNGPDTRLAPGVVLRYPNVLPSSRQYEGVQGEHAELMSDLNVDGRQPQGDRIVVDKSERVLKVFDGQDRLVAQFPVSMGSTRDPLPLGQWKVTTYAYLPPFNFQPELLWYVSDDEQAQKLPPGPNGPVGVAWLDLTKEHYGIHGTPEPSTIGRAESAGCIRMTNWDVARLSRIVKPGVQAVFQA